MKVINHVGLSGGKDSTALWGWIINDSGYPPESIRGSFADTENEYQEVYDQIHSLNLYGLKHGIAPIRYLRSEGFLNLAIRKKRFPSACARFCTEELKIIPFLYYVQELQLDGYEVIGHTGVRAAESTERSLLEEYGTNPISGLKERRPLITWSIDDVWAAHKKYKLPINPLYLQGWKRVGCRLCIMSNKADVRRTAVKRPEVINEIAEWELIVGQDTDYKMSTFFRADTTPEHVRTITMFRAKDNANGKAGDKFNVAPIKQIAKWSQTLRGGKQAGFDFMFEDDDSHSPCKMGYCE